MSVYWAFGALAACLVVAVVWSLVRSDERTERPDEAERLEGALEALRALEFERETGKVSDEEYGRLRARLEIDALRARDAAATAGGRAGTGERAGTRKTDRACPACGRALRGSERFCPSCGEKVAPSAALEEPGGRARGEPDAAARGEPDAAARGEPDAAARGEPDASAPG